jgi:hypothetical protein
MSQYALEITRHPGQYVFRMDEQDAPLFFETRQEAEDFLWSKDAILAMMLRVVELREDAPLFFETRLDDLKDWMAE